MGASGGRPSRPPVFFQARLGRVRLGPCQTKGRWAAGRALAVSDAGVRAGLCRNPVRDAAAWRIFFGPGWPPGLVARGSGAFGCPSCSLHGENTLLQSCMYSRLTCVKKHIKLYALRVVSCRWVTLRWVSLQTDVRPQMRAFAWHKLNPKLSLSPKHAPKTISPKLCPTLLQV